MAFLTNVHGKIAMMHIVQFVSIRIFDSILTSNLIDASLKTQTKSWNIKISLVYLIEYSWKSIDMILYFLSMRIFILAFQSFSNYYIQLSGMWVNLYNTWLYFSRCSKKYTEISAIIMENMVTFNTWFQLVLAAGRISIIRYRF